MRKLLVASQKSGVGKTTTSMNLAAATALTGSRALLLDADPLSNISTALNLAEHPRRLPLRQNGIDLPGALVPNVIPGLDVLSPYEEGSCSDAELDQLLRALATPPARRCYGCLVVDVPPFLGGNPAQLIGSCDDFLLVMRAEAMAYRTLPAFLELVQRCSRDGHTIHMSGILLTLPEGEEPGCRWERELRGRFGSRVLPEVIPHDETIGKALGSGQISSHVHPESPAARQYHQLIEKLGLASEPCEAIETEQILQALKEAVALAGPPAVAPSASMPPAAETACQAKNRVPKVERPASTPEAAKPSASGGHRVRRLGRSADGTRPRSSERSTPPPPTTPAPIRIKVVPAPSHPVDSPAVLPGGPLTSHALAQLWPLWILLGAVLGGGLRFVPLTTSLLPILVGLGVALLVVVVLYAMALNPERMRLPSASRKGAKSAGHEQKRKKARTETRKDPITDRLASFASAKRVRRDTDAN